MDAFGNGARTDCISNHACLTKLVRSVPELAEKVLRTLRTRIAAMPQDDINPPGDTTSGWKSAAIILIVLVVVAGFLVYRELGTTIGVAH